ncbi:class I SAM-dependent methyltransferase [Planctomycetota bacterium]
MIELFIPPILGDRKIVASFFNCLQGRGFRYIDPMSDPVTYPRGKRETDYTTKQKNTVTGLIVGKDILEIGCGAGAFIKSLCLEEYVCTGVDPNCTPVSSQHLKLLSGIVQEFNFPEQSFDTVISFKTLEHIPDAKSELVYWRKLARRRVILVLPCQRYRRYVYDGHINFYPDEYQLRLQLGLSSDANVLKVNHEWLVYEDV